MTNTTRQVLLSLWTQKRRRSPNAVTERSLPSTSIVSMVLSHGHSTIFWFYLAGPPGMTGSFSRRKS
jgi:hypothetical protein